MLEYTSDSSSDSLSDVENEELSSSSSSSMDKKNSKILEQYYESSSEDEEHIPREYSPSFNENLFYYNDNDPSLFICLSEGQTLLLSGQFNLQVVKGGIIYNGVHYDASWRVWEYWHPMCDSISPIVSSHYAGWDKKIFLNEKQKQFLGRLESFPCILRLSNGCNIYKVVRKLPEVRDVFGSIGLSFENEIPKDTFTFNILPNDFERILILHPDWTKTLEKLHIFHTNSAHDMRVMVIGGKNSGKSTLTRLLLQKFLHAEKNISENHTVQYLDIDCGQPEFSAPDSISWCRLDSSSLSLGQHLCQGKFATVRQYMIGSSTPQDWPLLYLEKVSLLLREWEKENFMGTTFLNLPGWIKGFGIEIINFVILNFKPTHIVFLSNHKNHLPNLLKIPEYFGTLQRPSYQPDIIHIPSSQHAKLFPYDTQKYNATNIRMFKTIAYMHRKKDRTYIENPLLTYKPIQVGFGKTGVYGYQFLQTFELPINKDDLKLSLDGTIVGLHLLKEEISEKEGLEYPLDLTRKHCEMTFVTLVLIHSINMKSNYMNMYLPPFILDEIKKKENLHWVIVRGKTDTPLPEAHPPKNILPNISDEFPYMSSSRKKKYEHVWKVRKNVMRRGHHIK